MTTSFMNRTFTACRISGDGNAVFPDEIIIDEDEEVVIHRKPKLICSKETKVRYAYVNEDRAFANKTWVEVDESGKLKRIFKTK